MSETLEREYVRRVEEDILAEKGKSIVREMLEAKGEEHCEDGQQSGIEEKCNNNLDIGQVLFLLRKKVTLGPGLPKFLEGPPWRLPGHPQVNSVLEMSIEAQEGRIKDSGDFEEFILSNSSLAIAGLVRQVFRARFFHVNRLNICFNSGVT